MSDDLLQSLQVELGQKTIEVQALTAHRDSLSRDLDAIRERLRIVDSRRCALIDLIRWETDPPAELPY